MKILLVGSGGREHALAQKLLSSAREVVLFAAPGSDAIAEIGTCLPFGVEDVEGIAQWARSEQPDLVVIGPEAPLVAGLGDVLRAQGIKVFGHGAATARLEGSKAFAKDFMMRHGAACAASETVTDLTEGEAAIRRWPYGYPVVLKADGLAAGKGVVLAQSEPEALDTLRAFLGGQFGDASRTVVLEEPLFGMELSLHVLVDADGERASYAMLPPCQDHKRIFEGDEGPNTGGMGVFGPIPFITPAHLDELEEKLVRPTVAGLQKDGLRGQGVLFLGVMWTAHGPKLLEYNVRFGDPETQVLMELLDEDLAEVLLEVAEGRLVQRRLKVKAGTAICVVLAAEGYPETARKGVPIQMAPTDLRIIHAGTTKRDGQWVVNGGRVLNLVTVAADLAAAREKVASEAGKVQWPGMQMRRDIGLKSLQHAQAGKGPQDTF